MKTKSRWMRWVVTLSADPALPLPWTARPARHLNRAQG